MGIDDRSRAPRALRVLPGRRHARTGEGRRRHVSWGGGSAAWGQQPRWAPSAARSRPASWLLPLLPLPLLLGLTATGFVALAGLAGAVFGGGPTRKLLAGIAAVAVMLSASGTGGTPGLLHREETLYGSVRVTEREWRDGRTVRELWQNGGSSSAEDVATGSPAHPYATAVGLLMEPVIERGDSVLVLGSGALSFPVALTCQQPQLTVDVVELDPAVTRLARDYFAYGDARIGLNSA